MMMITATIFATGPWTESRIDCSGASHGMFDAGRAGNAHLKAESSKPRSAERRDGLMQQRTFIGCESPVALGTTLRR